MIIYIYIIYYILYIIYYILYIIYYILYIIYYILYIIYYILYTIYSISKKPLALCLVQFGRVEPLYKEQQKDI